MTYAVFQAGSSELICTGSAEQCAEALGATPEQFQKFLNAPSYACKIGWSIHKIESENPMQCLCENCIKSPRTKGVVSASCNDVHCDRWEKWSKRYWNRLRKKYGKKK